MKYWILPDDGRASDRKWWSARAELAGAFPFPVGEHRNVVLLPVLFPFSAPRSPALIYMPFAYFRLQSSNEFNFNPSGRRNDCWITSTAGPISPKESRRITENPYESKWTAQEVGLHLESAALPSSDQRCNYSPNPWTCKSGFASIGDDHIGHLATLYPAILMRPVSGKVPVADPGESLTARIWVSKEYRKSSGEDFCFNPVRSFDSNPRKSWCIHLDKIL